jgi:hypothetical protein
MKEIKYYHLRRNLTDEKPLDFVSLDNAYDFLVGFFTDKQAKVWHCDGIEDSAEPTPKEWVKAVMEELGQIEFEIITGDGEHYDLWLSEKELRLADDGIADAFAHKTEIDSGLEDSNKDIFEYWKNLAQTGDAEAQNNLGLMYCGGHGTEKDEELALKYFQLAAEQGHADAQENLRLLKEAIDAENENKK